MIAAHGVEVSNRFAELRSVLLPVRPQRRSPPWLTVQRCEERTHILRTHTRLRTNESELKLPGLDSLSHLECRIQVRQTPSSKHVSIKEGLR